MKLKKILKVLLSIIVLASTTTILALRTLNLNKSVAFSQSAKISCYKDDSAKKYKGYKSCDKEFNREDWTMVMQEGTSDSVVLYMQGGPVEQFLWTLPDGTESAYFKKYMSAEKLLNGRKDLKLVAIKEIWHMKAPLLHQSYKPSLKQAIQERDEYMSIVDKIISSYKNQGKKVILAGHSLGALQVNEYLKQYGTSKISQAFSMHGRLNMDKDIVKAFTKRSPTIFDKNNKAINHSLLQSLALKFFNIINPNVNGLYIHAPAYGSNSYTNEIKESKLTHNEIYWFSSEYDAAVGNFSKEEKTFTQKVGNYIEFSRDEVQKLAGNDPISRLGWNGHAASTDFDSNKHWSKFIK